MKITIQSPDFKAKKKLLDYVKSNVMKLSVYGDRMLETQVVLKIDKSDTKENKICELKLVIRGNDLFARKQSGTFEDAVMRCVEAIKHQVGRWKDTVNNGKLRGSVTPLESEETTM
ncbi:MAG TPA: HPF/RaiA family ribosome-associated protein [Cyclobacteriaceae bacterium]|nr:HPF/RaiA family ribosome-associated protein [Cyclobacteriaceae bacterium]